MLQCKARIKWSHLQYSGSNGSNDAFKVVTSRAASLASGGVTANCICPGWTETAIIEPQIAACAAELGGDRAAKVLSYREAT